MTRSLQSHSRRDSTGHSLLETLVAAGIFVLISVALSGVWVMYGKALAKSGEYLAANHLARGVTEGLITNGYDWLANEVAAGNVPAEDEYLIIRRVRGRTANIRFNILYDLSLNTDPDPLNGVTDDRPLFPSASEDICRISVTVRWKSPNGSQDIENGKYNNSVTYSSYVYKEAI